MKTVRKLDRVLRSRLLWLALGSMLGAGLGMTADVVSAEPLFPPPQTLGDWVGRVFVGLLLSPFVVTFGAHWAVFGVPPPYAVLLGLGGLVFWPLYALLARRWMKTGAARWLLLLVLWCVQGFLLLLHRMDVLLSV